MSRRQCRDQWPMKKEAAEVNLTDVALLPSKGSSQQDGADPVRRRLVACTGLH